MTARLLDPSGETLAGWRGRGGLAVATPEHIIELAGRADLRGRGGAGFPLARKLATVAAAQDPVRIAVANGEEGEPGSVKDRTLLRSRPHLVLDGLRLAAGAIGAKRAIVYVSDALSAASVRRAWAEQPWTGAPDVEVVEVASSYVAGEETALVRALDGGPALPTAKPPRPFEAGVGGHPTLVSNVETLAALAMLAAVGEQRYGRGTLLATVSSAQHPGALVEVPLGTPLGEVVALVCDPEDVRAVLVGGLFGGVQPRSVLDVDLDQDSLRAAGTALGCAAFHVLAHDDCVVEVVTDAISYLGRESSRQCGSCFKGTAAMAITLRRVAGGQQADDDVESLTRWATTLRGRGNCALLDASCLLLASLLEHWRADLDAHGAGHACEPCLRRVGTDGFSVTRLHVQPAYDPTRLEGTTP